MGAVFGNDRDDLATTLDDLLEEVALRHLVLDEVLADLHQQFGVAQVVHVDLGTLEAVNEGEAGCLVATPRVLRPFASTNGLVRSDPAHCGIEE